MQLVSKQDLAARWSCGGGFTYRCKRCRGSEALTLLCCSPMICLMAWISALPLICTALASRTFSSFPLQTHTCILASMLPTCHPLCASRGQKSPQYVTQQCSGHAFYSPGPAQMPLHPQGKLTSTVFCLRQLAAGFDSHLSGKTPKLSLPTTLRPAMASVAAESPSVRIKVH